MGNNSTRESRGSDSASAQRPSSAIQAASSPSGQNVYVSRSGRGSRPDLSFLGIGSSSNAELPERRETKQEREVRKLEKERVARAKERERSIKEEHVDGGYLVTMGVYTGLEDFSKEIVRQLMIERRIAPFWRGLDDVKDDWTEHQLVAAGRGLPIPAADEIPQDDLTRAESLNVFDTNLKNLMAPISSRSQSAASDASASLSLSHPGPSNNGTPSPPASPTLTSPFRPRSKTFASLTTPSRNPSSTDMTPREIQLPRDPFVNGQAIEVCLYKETMECPICFLYYPPYLNKTRCCDQAICSECFVQIKRPDPHPPEHDHNDPSNPAPPPTDASIEPESLVSEPAMCPYCQQPDFGVTYEPPKFRRGLSYATNGLMNYSSATTSTSSLHASGSPTTLNSNTQKRRTTSISANASTVITTDRVRPDWATKLASARSHLARRSAAATALHTAAFVIGNGSTDRGFGFGSRGRFARNRSENSPGGASGPATPPVSGDQTSRSLSDQLLQMRRDVQEAGGSRRRSRMDDLEEMMMMEAIRLSIAAEEDRKKKADKEAAKEAKKKAKEDKKREKKERKGVYGSGGNSASGSTLSLSLGLGRRRGNSGGSNLARHVTPETEEPTTSKGKEVDRNPQAGPAPIEVPRTGGASNFSGIPGARHLETSILQIVPDGHSAPSPTAPDKPSHLRQMSNASSPASSFVESAHGSLRNDHHGHQSSSSFDTPNASGTNVARHSGGTPEGSDSNDNAGTESMFNFQSLAAMIGAEDDEKAGSARHVEHLEGEGSRSNSQDESATSGLEESIATLKVEGSGTAEPVEPKPATTLLESQQTTPEVTITPGTPALGSHGNEHNKQLGSDWDKDHKSEITQ